MTMVRQVATTLLAYAFATAAAIGLAVPAVQAAPIKNAPSTQAAAD
jgi:hypothetical protein